MNKRIILLFCLFFIFSIAFSETQTFSGSIGSGNSIEGQKGKAAIKIDPEMQRFIPKNGMLPYFNEQVYSSHKEANEILELVGAEQMPDFYPGHKFELPEITNKTQKALQKRIDNYIRLELLKYEFQESIADKSDSTVVNTIPSRDLKAETKIITRELKEIDTELFQEIKNNTPEATKNIMDFVIKRTNKGNVAGITHIVTNLKETIQKKRSGTDLDSNSGMISPGGRGIGDFFANGGADKIISFIDNVISVIGQVSQLLGTGQEFAGKVQETLGVGKQMVTQFHQIFCMVNNIFSSGTSTQMSGGAKTGVSLGSNFNTDSPSDLMPLPFQPTSSGSTSEDYPTGTPVDESEQTEQPEYPTGTPVQQNSVPTGTLSKKIDFKNLITNVEFTDLNTMNPEAIQQFFVRKGSKLKDAYRGQYPANIIHQVCSKYNINPKVILATAQKEQSLITKKNLSQHKLDWAMGVGCPDNGYHNPKYKGLDKQLESAIVIFKKWYDDGLNKNISANGTRKKVNYGTAWQTIKNEATYSLYMYTPHTVDIKLGRKGGGNYLFGQIYIGFFGGFYK